MAEGHRDALAVARGAAWNHGYRLGMKMAADAKHPRAQKRSLKRTTRQLLAAFPPATEEVDLRTELDGLSDAALWEGACALAEDAARADHKRARETGVAAYPPGGSVSDWCSSFLEGTAIGDGCAWSYPLPATRGKSVTLAGWQGLRLEPLRALSLALGDSLTAVDLSSTKLTDHDVQAFCARLFALRTLKARDCDRLTNQGCKFVTQCCHDSLTQLDVSGCSQLNSDACGWLGGIVGIGAAKCHKLLSLDVSRCPLIQDRALVNLAHGCKRLQFLSVAKNERVTDSGVVALAKGCATLKILDVSDCQSIGDRAFRSLGHRCHRLTTLLAPRAGLLQDLSIRSLAQGCPALTCLDVAGAQHLSESVFGELCSGARGMRHLNVTGCEEVTSNGIRALCRGVGHVREARAFFGFCPLETATEKLLREAQEDLEDRSCREIVVYFRAYQRRCVASGARVELRQHGASRRIAKCCMAWLRRRRQANYDHLKRRELYTQELQRFWRGYCGRRDIWAAKEWRRKLQLHTNQVIGFQAMYRGYKVRLVDPAGCLPAIRRLRARRKRNRQNAAAAKLQALGRGVRARRKALVLAQVKVRRERDERIAASIVQSTLRALHARHEVKRLRLRRERLAALHDHASRVVTKFMRLAGGQTLEAKLRAIMERKKRLQNGASLIMKRCTRGLFGRQRARRRRKFVAMLDRQVTVIQKFYRGSRVMDWRHLRMNFIARHVMARKDFEIAQREANRQRKFAAWQQELAKDSCSDSDGDAGGELDPGWMERRNLDGGLVWVHHESGEVSTIDPRTDPVDAELIGCSVRVFWPLEGEWFEGTLAKFHRRRRKYRVEYADGDHEWLDVEQASERLQLYDASGSWSDFNVAVRPALIERQGERAQQADLKVRSRRLADETRAWTILPEKESGSEDEEDAQAALRKARERMERAKQPKRERWTNSLTGDIRFLSPEAAFWVESRDADKNFCFEHGETRERVYYDPRFMKDTDVPNVRKWKLECLNALRPAVYLCAGLVEAWDGAAEGAQGKKARQETLKRVLKYAKTFVRDLSSEVLRAKELWLEEDFDADAELCYAAYTLHRLNELKLIAEEEHTRGVEAKRTILREAKRFQGVWCRACRHKCLDQRATHCPTCGVRFTAKGIIAVGDVGSENFAESTRASRGSRPGSSLSLEAEASVESTRASRASRPGSSELAAQPSVSFALEPSGSAVGGRPSLNSRGSIEE